MECRRSKSLILSIMFSYFLRIMFRLFLSFMAGILSISLLMGRSVWNSTALFTNGSVLAKYLYHSYFSLRVTGQ